MMIDQSMRDRISRAICEALRPLPVVLAAWEGGSAAFGAVDGYSDIDLNVLVDNEAAFEALYAAAEASLETVPPITASHVVPPGRYYKLKDGGEFLLVDLCFYRAGAADHPIDVERHGQIVPLFDKGDWLRPTSTGKDAVAIKRDRR